MKLILVLATCIGLGFAAPQPRNLADDLQAFIDLLPVADIKAIADEHLATDGAFAAVVVYLQGPEWQELVSTVLAKPTAQEFVQYLNDHGIPVDEIINWIHDLIANASPGVEPDASGSLRPLLDEIEAILPVGDLVALLNDKLQNSPDFQDLYATVSSEKAHALVEEVRALDEVQRLAQELRDMGVKVDEVLAAIYEFLGWGQPKISHRSLLSDLLEFVELIPIDDIRTIVDAHLANDPALAAVIVYLQGPEWEDLVNTVLAKPTAQEIVQYLNDHGIPVDLILLLIRSVIDGATPGVEGDASASLRPLLDEVEAILPVNDLVNLLNDKLQNSADFQDLYTTISSEKVHALVEEVRAMDEVQRLAQELKNMGVKVDEALAAVYEFLGWGQPKKF